MKVAIQGGPASFHAVVAERLLGQVDFVYCDTFSQVFMALKNNVAEKAVVANENSLFGSIYEVYDLLLSHQYPIRAEAVEHIHQQLIGWPETKLGDITEVYSHPVALDQCRRYLETHLPSAEAIEHPDTATAVEYIKKHQLKHAVAIAGKAAAALHDMAILDSDIEDEKTNLTRFLLLDPSATEPIDGANRAIIVLATANSPGALYHALGAFADQGVNLTKLESRPIRGEAFRYQFFVDADITASQLTAVTSSLAAQDCTVTLLGHFKAATQEEL